MVWLFPVCLAQRAAMNWLVWNWFMSSVWYVVGLKPKVSVQNWTGSFGKVCFFIWAVFWLSCWSSRSNPAMVIVFRVLLWFCGAVQARF